MATVDEFTVDEVDDDEDDPNIIENEDLEDDFDKNEDFYDLGQKQANLNESSIKKEEEDQSYEDAFDHNLNENFGEENVIQSHNETDIEVRGYHKSSITSRLCIILDPDCPKLVFKVIQKLCLLEKMFLFLEVLKGPLRTLYRPKK